MNKKILKKILDNQRSIMIWLSKGEYHEGYFKYNIEETEKLLEEI